MERPIRRGGLLGPIVLVGLGVILLLNNLGRLDWGVWEALIRLWPVLIIGAGLDLLIGRRSLWGSLLVVVLILGVAAGSIALYENRPSRGAGLEQEAIQIGMGEASQGVVEIDFSVGRLEVADTGTPEMFAEGQAAIRAGENLISEARIEGDTLYYHLSSDVRNWTGAFVFGSWLNDRLWTLGLSPDVPLTLSIDTGVGATDIDLSGLRVRELDLNGGVGRTVVTLPAEGGARVRMDLGVGENVLRVPEGVAVQVRVDGGLAPVTAPSSYERRDGLYISPGYATADERVDVVISAGVGSIVIREVPAP
jgi:hypothetical protein